ncbi:Hypothetical predicted protein [Pelobates cultripes]|uniref:Reverse transcriptase n=1 Tax=Pelobates cultripes TaxID=61616 RepID=A0AAD1S0P6_PELCU|nr:Hypothetical predicted protein [Pelobates cultripes]
METLHIDLPIQEALQQTYPFNLQTTHIQYLGVCLPAELSQSYSLNYTPTIQKITQIWKDMPISWLGRPASIKMNVLPRPLYLFQALPIPIPISGPDFKMLQKTINKFIWSNIRARINRQTLYAPNKAGGLGLPHLTHYYQAKQLTQAQNLHAPLGVQRWVDLDHDIFGRVFRSLYIWLPQQARPPHPIKARH